MESVNNAAGGILGCSRALTNGATGLAKAMGEALQQSCRAALGNLIGDPLVEFPINFQPQFAIQKGALVAHHCMPRQGLERFQHGSSIPKAHSFSRDGWSSFTRHQNPS